MSNSTNSRQAKITIIFILILLGILLFSAVMVFRVVTDRKFPKLVTSEENTAIRGSIITKDGFSVAFSQKLYKVMIDTRSIDPEKKELFIKLYSLYTDQDQKEIRKILNEKKGYVQLSNAVDAKDAIYLKELSRKLSSKNVFIAYDVGNGNMRLNRLDVVESGQNRSYITGQVLTPVIGYSRKQEDNKKTRRSGVKGLEKSYDEYLAPVQDAKLLGPRDVKNNIVLTSESNIANRVDGLNLHISVSLKFQSMLEKIADQKREYLDATEILIGVMESSTGKFLALASSSRYDPANITKGDYRALNSTATEYAYEVGSVIKPFVFAILLNENKIRGLGEMIETFNGRYELKGRIIRDTKAEIRMSAEDVIAKSSNIGMIMLSKRLSGIEFYNGLTKFGFSQKTGIDMPYEQVGILPTANKLDSETYKATVSYGYGMSATFMQMMKAYNVFNNKGNLITPMFGEYFERNGRRGEISPTASKQEILSPEVVKQMKRVLVRVVEGGTGKRAYIPGLEIGGKTGTAHIASRGGYARLYNGSFFGFVNDTHGHSYTIGVLTREPKRPYYHFGSLSALPAFREAVELLVREGYLIPSPTEYSVSKDTKNKDDGIVRD
ncbi:penicillin-binding protein 2 [Campylobacter sp. 9BO]|uniref:peptidoglycan D,D-transpeptidase FtsI family protein n=1 Tax=Campylobacter sp. 9BO TaxID=3424759 RepID=UPI003D344C2B